MINNYIKRFCFLRCFNTKSILGNFSLDSGVIINMRLLILIPYQNVFH